MPKIHLISCCGNFLWQRKVTVNESELPETLRKLCAFTKFSHQEIKWNYGILCSESSQVRQKLRSIKYLVKRFHNRYLKSPKYVSEKYYGNIEHFPFRAAWSTLFLTLIHTALVKVHLHDLMYLENAVVLPCENQYTLFIFCFSIIKQSIQSRFSSSFKENSLSFIKSPSSMSNTESLIVKMLGLIILLPCFCQAV